MASSEQTEKNTKSIKKTGWKIHNRILSRRKIRQEKGMVDKRRTSRNIVEKDLLCGA
jgi:hypothetical protein